MNLPIYKDKYTHKGLIDSATFVSYSDYPDEIPENILIAFEPVCLEHFQGNYSITGKIELRTDLIIYQHKNMGFVRLSGIGGPNLVAAVEEMIILGAKSFITVGTAGGLKKEGVYVIHQALRDEGTSYHYLPPERYTKPDPGLMAKLFLSLNYLEIPCSYGITWTTDAPFRETLAEVENYAKENIDTVEMECASLFAVAKSRNVAAASVVVVGDVLSETWTPKFNDITIKKMLCRLVDAGVDCLVKQGKTTKKEDVHKVTEAHYPGLKVRSIGPMQMMRTNCCMAPGWVMTYGLSKLEKMLSGYNIPSHHYELYMSYFRELWEHREATPASMCHPYILQKVEDFTEDLRATKRGIFGE